MPSNISGTPPWDWGKVGDQLYAAGLTEPAIFFANGDGEGEEADEMIGMFTALNDLIVGCFEYYIRRGDFQFTPTSINRDYVNRPMDLLTDWLDEAVEEYLIGGALEVRDRGNGNGEHSGGEVRQQPGEDRGSNQAAEAPSVSREAEDRGDGPLPDERPPELSGWGTSEGQGVPTNADGGSSNPGSVD